MQVSVFSPNSEPKTLEKLPTNEVLKHLVSVPAKSIYDISASLIFPEKNPQITRNPFTSAVDYSPTADAAFLECRPRTYRVGKEVFEQWAIAAITKDGAVDFVIQRLPISAACDRSGEFFFTPARQLLSLATERSKERSLLAKVMQHQRGDLFVVNCPDEKIPESVKKLLLPSNYYQAKEAYGIFDLTKESRARLVLQCADNRRIVSRKGDNDVATIGSLFNGAISGSSYIGEFSLDSQREEFGIVITSDGRCNIFRKPSEDVDRLSFLAAITYQTSGEFGVDRYLSEYHLRDVETATVKAAVAEISLMRIRRIEAPLAPSHNASFKARHLLPLANGNVEDRAALFS